MKAIFFVLPLIIISNLGCEQIPKNAIAFEDKEFNNYFLKKENIPVVKGKILNLTNGEIKQIKIESHIVTPFGSLQEQRNCELNADGTFEIKLDYAFPYQQIFLIVGDLFFAGLYVNKELYVELDAHLLKLLKYAPLNTSGVKYLGKDGALNTYMNNHFLHAREKRLELDKAIQLLKNKTIHIEKYDSLYTVLTELDNEYIKQNPSDFSWLVINERESQYYAYLCADNFF